MKVSPEEVHHLYIQGLTISEIARRLKISRTWVNIKLREFDLNTRKKELDDEKADLNSRKANVEAREREISKIPELEEKVHSLNSEAQFLQSNNDNLSKVNEELEAKITSKKEVLEKSKEYEESEAERSNLLSEQIKAIAENKAELSNSLDLMKESGETLADIQRQLENKSSTLHRLDQEIFEKREEHAGLASENKHLEEKVRAGKNALYEIEQSYYGFAERTKQIALSVEGGWDEKTKTHEELREKVLEGMKTIMDEAKTSKTNFESYLQAISRDPARLKKILL